MPPSYGGAGYGAPPPPPPPPPPGYGAPGGYPGAKPAGTNILAIISLVAGIVSIVLVCCYIGFVAGPAAIVTGFIARKQIDETGQGGKGMATAGLITGIIGFAITVIFVILAVVLNVTGTNYQYGY
jgi:hypothetical protein